MLTSEHAVAINFNDEALWDTNFDTAVTQAKALGVTAVRVWIGFNSYDDRPNAWDIVPPFGAVTAGTADPNDPNIGSPAVAMRDLFKLSRAGFSVLLVTNNNTGLAPTGPAQVQGWIAHLMTATETPTSTQTLADVVDYWEIGNEPDTGGYWAPSAVNKTTGLQSYVDNFLIPAAQVLHRGPVPEKVVSAGVSYSPNDLNTIINELKAQNALSDVDYLGFHPYATVTAAADNIAINTALALKYANAAGKPLMATEWNIRGYGNTGANDALWGPTLDTEYRTVIEPNYAVAYYFALVNNWAARGGSTSARPGGVLKHNSPVTVTPASPTADLATYYNSPLITADPFFTTYSKWQLATVSGSVNSSGGVTPTTTVYIDANNNGVLDTSEYSTTTAANGTYSLTYSVSVVGTGLHTLRIAPPSAVTAVATSAGVDLEPLGALTGVNFAVVPVSPTAITVGTVAGTLWFDKDGDKTLESGESLLAGWTVYLDIDGDGVLDPADPQAVTAADGTFTIAYDTTQFTAKTASLLVSKTSAYATSTPVAVVSLAGGYGQTGYRIGVYQPPGSISGTLWNDTDGDGTINNVEIATGARVVYLDANKNGVLDTGETQVTSDASGKYTFANLAAGTYYVSRVFPTGFHLSNSKTSYLTVQVSAGQNVTAVNIGTTDKSAPVATSPTTPVTPTPPATGTASVSGSILASSGSYTAALLASKWTAYIDSNSNGSYDATDYTVAVDASGKFAFKNLAAGTYAIGLVAQKGWAVTSPAGGFITNTLSAGRQKTGQNFVIKQTTAATTPTTPTTPATSVGTASISGKLYAEVSKNTAAMVALPWTVFLDTNKNGLLDAGEVSTQMKSDTTWAFANLAAGSYTVALIDPAHWATLSPVASKFAVTLKDGSAKTAQNFIVRKLV